MDERLQHPGWLASPLVGPMLVVLVLSGLVGAAYALHGLHRDRAPARIDCTEHAHAAQTSHMRCDPPAPRA
jgi:hypothetical protein